MLGWNKKKRLQSRCLHDWHILSERYETDGFDGWEEADVYCPLCEKVSSTTLGVAKRLVKQSEIRKQYSNDSNA